MPGVDVSFSPPVQFSPVWFWLGLALLLVVVAWFVAVPLLTRRKRTRVESVPLAPSGYAVQQTYLALIDEVADAYSRGVIPSRDAHQRLSAIVRGYAEQSWGLRATYMTVGDLRAHRVDALADTVAALYPGEFGPRGEGSVGATADRARWLVRTWS